LIAKSVLFAFPPDNKNIFSSSSPFFSINCGALVGLGEGGENPAMTWGHGMISFSGDGKQILKY
jgi:hypothetical protein